MILRFSALLLVLWYCFSVIGFGVHTCNTSGKSFVATVVSGFSCGDIHPEHNCSDHECHSDCNECHTCACHSCEVRTSVQSESCCTDEYHVLILTGSLSDDERGLPYDCTFHVIHSEPIGQSVVYYSELLNSELEYDDGLIVRRGLRPLLNIWRI